MEFNFPQTISDWKLKDTLETYDRETIFDYIDGAGEVYLMYDFKNVVIGKYLDSSNNEILVEVFDMLKPEDAFGVFSHSRESEQSGIGGGFEMRGSLICFWKSQYFFCILAQNQTEQSKHTIIEFAKTIDSSFPSTDTPPPLLQYLPNENLNEHTVRYFHSYRSLNYHYFLTEQNILNLNDNTKALFAEYQPGTTYLLAIKYQNKQDAKVAYDSFIDSYIPEAKATGSAQTENNKWIAVKTNSEYLIVTFDAPDKTRAVNLVESFINNLSTQN